MIKIIITAHINDNNNHTNFNFKGDFALEFFILKLIEKYYGVKTKQKIESILKLKSTEEEYNFKKEVEA